MSFVGDGESGKATFGKMKGGRSWQQGLRLVGQLAQRQRQQQRPQCEPLIQFGIRDPPSVFQRKFPLNVEKDAERWDARVHSMSLMVLAVVYSIILPEEKAFLEEMNRTYRHAPRR